MKLPVTILLCATQALATIDGGDFLSQVANPYGITNRTMEKINRKFFVNNTYYVKAGGGNGTGLDSNAQAWSFAKFQATPIPAGSIVRFKRGDTFAGSFNPSSGTFGSHIIYDAYSTGPLPIITGLKTFAQTSAVWTLLSGHIYYTTLDVERLQVVTIDGALTGMARYPKSGYLPIGSHNNLSSITAASIGTLPSSFAGGECVIKKGRYLIDRHGITSRSGNTLNLTSPTDFGQTDINDITDGNGYFVQNHLAAVTQDKDWYYDVAAKRLYVHFGAGNYTAHTVQASTVGDLINANSQSYIDFHNMDIRGANYAGINIQYADHITIDACNISYTTEGILGQGYKPSNLGGNITVNNCYINQHHSAGIWAYEDDNFTVTNSTIRDIAMIPGMARSGDERANGINIHGDYPFVSACTIKNVGYCGVGIYGGHGAIVEKTIVDSFCTNRDDGGGIYLYGLASQTFIPRQIRNNFVTHGFGSIDGVSPELAGIPFAMGIYLDYYSSNVNVKDNLLTYTTGAGVFLNGSNNDTLYHNTIFTDNQIMALLIVSAAAPDPATVNLSITNNEFISSSGTEILADFEMYTPLTSAVIGNFNNNYFYRPFSNNTYIRRDDRRNNGQIIDDYSISSFFSTFNKTLGTQSNVPINSASDFKLIYNNNPSPVDLSLTGIYKDLSNASFPGLVTLPPYSGKALIYNAALPVSAAPGLKINFRKVITQ